MTVMVAAYSARGSSGKTILEHFSITAPSRYCIDDRLESIEDCIFIARKSKTIPIKRNFTPVE